MVSRIPTSEMPSPGESRERRRPQVAAAIETRASSDHPTRNEDAALGDSDRIARELENLPPLRTEDPQADNETLAQSLRIEQEFAPKLADKGVYGVLDGISGTKQNGSGLLGSRIVSAELSRAMAALPDKADAEQTHEAIRQGIFAGHKAIAAKREGREDLDQMATTVDVAKVIENDDGSFDVAYGHVGDSRIYVQDGKTGELRQVTKDETAVTEQLEAGELTPDEYDLVVNAHSIMDVPPKLKISFRLRSTIQNYVGTTGELKVNTGVIKGLKKGDRLLLTSDGIPDNLTDEQIAETLGKGGGMKALADLAAAKSASREKGTYPDDITGTVVELGMDAVPESGPRKKRTVRREVPPIGPRTDPAIVELSREYQAGAERAEALQDELGVWSDQAQEMLDELIRNPQEAGATPPDRIEKLRELAETHEKLKHISDEWKEVEKLVRQELVSDEQRQLKEALQKLEAATPTAPLPTDTQIESRDAPKKESGKQKKSGSWFSRLFD